MESRLHQIPIADFKIPRPSYTHKDSGDDESLRIASTGFDDTVKNEGYDKHSSTHYKQEQTEAKVIYVY